MIGMATCGISIEYPQVRPAILSPVSILGAGGAKQNAAIKKGSSTERGIAALNCKR